jgi:hypothetical protein
MECPTTKPSVFAVSNGGILVGLFDKSGCRCMEDVGRSANVEPLQFDGCCTFTTYRVPLVLFVDFGWRILLVIKDSALGN